MGKLGGSGGRVVALALALLWMTGGRAQEGPPITLPGHVLPALSRATPVAAPLAAKSAAVAPITLTIVLRRSDPAGFQAYLRDVYDAESPSFHKFVSSTEMSERFGPSQGDYGAVLDYFASYGFTVAERAANRLTLVLTGTRDAAERALSVKLANYKIGARAFYANDTEPKLPADIARRVEAIIGLQNLGTPQPQNDAISKAFCNVTAWLSAYVLETDKNGQGKYNFSQTLFDKAYFNCLVDHNVTGYAGSPKKTDPPPPAWQGADGTGQTIGIVAFDTFATGDVADYIASIGLPASTLANVTQVHVLGGATAGANQSEVLLDIDSVLGVASGAHVKVFDAPFGVGSFQAVFNAMISSGVTIISNSWAYCEDQTTLADVQSIDAILQTAAASGISVVTGSGDHGSTCLDGSANVAHVPATSPHITAVGGTSLTYGPGYTYGNETWWDGSSTGPPGGQGGFGVSQFFARPSYQNGLSASAFRSIPDVALNADPANGKFICQASAGGCPSGLSFGGTSRSAPEFAAFVALLNQTQGSNLGFVNPLLYPLAGTDAFHDAASMGSDFSHVGLGSPNLARLHQHLTSQTAGPVDTTLSDVTAWSAGNELWSPNGANLPLLAFADGSTSIYVVVSLVDAFGNTLSGKNVALSSDSATTVITPASAVSNAANGAAVFKVTNLAFEPVTFTATVDGSTVLPVKPSVTFIPPVASAASIGASPTPVASDGVATTTITVTLKDALNRPSPGKLVNIDQAGGHSIITGPVPPVTDASGQIQFTASDGVAETVTYTAIDVSDGNLPVPGNATVVFTGGTTSCVGAPPVAGAGFTLTPWATGFFAQNFFFSNVNWGGCPGASNPTFQSGGGAFVADFRTGDLFKFALSGGAAAGNKLSNLNQTLTQPTFGKDGRLYATHGATGGGFTTGDIVEIDPATGAQLRVVASNLTCPAGLSVDPVSGDLFFGDDCFGAGSDNASIWRIHDPAGAATLSVYATLPSTPTGWLAFSPDGTLYAVTGYTNVQQVVQIGGTDTPQPAGMTTLSGISSTFWVTMGEVQNNGAARSLIVSDSNGIERVDITTNPFTKTILIASGSVGSGTIGPDGCLYTSGADTIYKLAASDGSCGFVPTNPGPRLTLAPGIATPTQGGAQSLTATFENVSVPAGTHVLFTILGANPQLKLAATDASGAATVTYLGSSTGLDTAVASGPAGGSTLVSNPASITWSAGRHLTFLDLSASPSGGSAGQSVTLRAGLADVSVTPAAPISGATIHLTLGSQSCDGVTDAKGAASCSVTPATAGQLTLAASYAGSSSFAPASASQAFGVVAGAVSAPDAPTIDSVSGGDGSITVFFTPPANDGGSPIISYAVNCTSTGGGAPGSQVGDGSPITVRGLTNGATYTCTVSATNVAGTGTPSGASGGVTLQQRSSSQPQPIPALDRAGLLILAALLAWLGSAPLRRRR